MEGREFDEGVEWDTWYFNIQCELSNLGFWIQISYLVNLRTLFKPVLLLWIIHFLLLVE